jgi:hypothetical protein
MVLVITIPSINQNRMLSNRPLLVLILLFHIFCTEASAQNDDVSFLLSKIKNTYAGHPENAKAIAFDNHVATILKQEKDTFLILSRIVSFFNDPHLRIFDAAGENVVKIDSLETEKSRKYALQYLADAKIKKDLIEGFYYNDKQTAISAIVKSKLNPNQYDLVLIESTSQKIPFGFITGHIVKDGQGQYFTEYRNPRSGRLYLKSMLKQNSTFIIGELTKLKKVKASESIPNIKSLNPIKVTTSGEQLDQDNYLLTIPDFGSENIEVVDSIVKRDHQLIANSKNLILDIRFNSGGTVRAYYPLLKYVYTKPIATISGYTFCSPDLLRENKESLEKLKNETPHDTLRIKLAEKDVQKVEKSIGKFLFESGDTLRVDDVLVNPKNVAIIANYACESAAEMMILDFKQSNKVTLFGEHTAGGIDYLDAYPIELPSKKYILNLATVKRFIAPGQTALDGKGIQPDVKIPDSCNDWPQFVKAYYGKHKKS